MVYLSLYNPNFVQNFCSQASKFGNFQFARPQILKFLVHKTTLSEAIISSQAPHLGDPGRTPLPEKKLTVPPRPLRVHLGYPAAQYCDRITVHAVTAEYPQCNLKGTPTCIR